MKAYIAFYRTPSGEVDFRIFRAKNDTLAQAQLDQTNGSLLDWTSVELEYPEQAAAVELIAALASFKGAVSTAFSQVLAKLLLASFQIRQESDHDNIPHPS